MKLSYDIRPCSIAVVADLCARYHGYGGAGRVAVYSFAIFELGRPVAAYAWQPPPPGVATALAPACPGAVLSLSRMVACPRSERRLNHISKPLRRQMRTLIDRTRWPVLVTFSDEGQGHSGHVYKCSGWTKTSNSRRRTYEREGVRISSYRNGVRADVSDCVAGWTTLQRWEHRACEVGMEREHLEAAGWRSVETGKRWRSGNPARKWIRSGQLTLF